MVEERRMIPFSYAVVDDEGDAEPVVVAKKSRETTLKGTLDAWG